MLKIAKVFFLTVSILLLSIWLFVRFYLEDYTKDKMVALFQEKTKGLYVMNIDDVDINLLTSSFDIEGIKIYADSSNWDEVTKDTMSFSFGFEVAEIEVSSFKWIHFLKTDSVAIDNIMIRDGGIELFEVTDTLERKNMLFELPKVVKGFTPQLTIEEVKVEAMAANLYSLDTARQQVYKSTLKKIGAGFYDFKIGKNTAFEKAPLFYADSSFFFVKQFEFEKKDLKFDIDKLTFSSKDSLFEVNQLTFDVAGDTGVFPSFKLINFNVKQLLLHNYFFADVLALQYDELFIKNISGGGRNEEIGSVKAKLHQRITSVVPKLHIGVLDIYGRHLQIGEADDRKSSFLADSISLAFFNLKIDSSIAAEEDKNVLFSERVTLSFANIKSKSVGGGNMTVKKMTVSSTDSLVYLFNLSLYKKGKYSLDVPETVIEKFAWQLYWNEGKIKIDNLTFNKPEIIVRSKSKKNDSTTNVATALSELSSDLNVKKIRVKKGTFKRYIVGATKGLQYLEANDLYLTLRGIHLRQGMSSREASTEVFSSVSSVYIKDYLLKTAGEQVLLKAKSIKNNGSHRNIIVEDIYVQKANELDIKVASLQLDNIDWENYWEGEGLLHIDGIKILKPEVTLLVKKHRKTTSDTLASVSLKEMLPLFIEDFSKGVEIDKIDLQNGKLITDISDSLQNHSFHNVNKCDLKFIGFKVYPDKVHNDFMFSDDVLVQLSDYTFKKDKLAIKVKKGELSVKKNSLQLQQVELVNKGLTISMPSMDISAILFSDYWMNRNLEMELISLNKPRIIVTKGEKKAQQVNVNAKNIDREEFVGDIADVLMGISNKIIIKRIKSEAGYFNFQLKKGKGTQLTELSDFSIALNNVLIDSTDGFRDQRVFYAKEIDLKGRNFKFLPVDRSHFILIDKIKVNSLDSSVYLSTLSFQVPSRIGVNIPSVSIKSIGLERFYKHQGLNVGAININNPDITVKVDKSLSNPFTVTPPSFFNLRKNLPGLIGEFTKYLSVDHLNLNNGSFFYEGKSYEQTSFHKIDNIELHVKEMKIDSSINNNSVYQTLFSEDIFYEFNGYSHTSADSVFLFAFDKISGSTKNGDMHLKNLVYKPYVKYDKYFNTLKYRTTRVDLKMENVHAHNFDYARAVHDQEISMSGLYFSDGLFNVFTDKRLEKDPDYSPPMPNDLMINTPFYVNIDTVGLSNTSFIYNEKEYGQTEVGAISFNDAEIKITNLTNDQANRVPTSLTGRAKFMDDGLLSLELEIPILSDEFQCQYSGALGQMDAYHINRMLEPNQGIGFEKGQINYVNFEAEIKGNITEGEMEASFNDLKLRVLHEDNQGKKGLTSMMSNILIPNKSKKKRRGKIHYISHSTDGFLKILWRGVRSGLTDTVLPEFLRQKK